MQTTIKIPEVLIGEIIRYALRTLSLAPTCADAQVFFAPNLLSLAFFISCNLPPFAFTESEQRELECFLAFFEMCAVFCIAFALRVTTRH
ncbi:hypothetical protein DNW53_08355 [Escherichia coli]|nr:hypothetical protein [Escherichia coli]